MFLSMLGCQILRFWLLLCFCVSIQATGFEPIILLLPQRLASAILAQCPIERWWDTTHTFYIVEREMTVTPRDFHRMIGLRCDSVTINLDGKSGTRLVIDLLGRSYSLDTIYYFNIKVDYHPLPQEMAMYCAQMARAFLLYIIGAYLFPNRGQTVSLRWLAFFHDFKVASGANQGQACLAYLYSCLDTLSLGVLCQLVGPWKLLEVIFFLFSLMISQKCIGPFGKLVN